MDKCKGKWVNGGGVKYHRWLWMARIKAQMCQFCDANRDRQGVITYESEQGKLL